MREFSFTLFLTFFQSVFAGAQTIEFEQTVRIKKENQNVFENLKPGEKVSLKNSESLLVLSEKGLPLLIFSPQSSSSKITISDADLNLYLQEQMQPTVNQVTNEIVNELRRAENLIQKKDFAQALNGITQIKNKYPGIASVYFMSGTLLYLLNNKSSAIEDLEKGLKIEPAHEAAQKLLAKLKAGGG